MKSINHIPSPLPRSFILPPPTSTPHDIHCTYFIVLPFFINI
jgi:hypothetical protein